MRSFVLTYVSVNSKLQYPSPATPRHPQSPGFWHFEFLVGKIPIPHAKRGGQMLNLGFIQGNQMSLSLGYVHGREKFILEQLFWASTMSRVLFYILLSCEGEHFTQAKPNNFFTFKHSTKLSKAFFRATMLQRMVLSLLASLWFWGNFFQSLLPFPYGIKFLTQYFTLKTVKSS